MVALVHKEMLLTKTAEDARLDQRLAALLPNNAREDYDDEDVPTFSGNRLRDRRFNFRQRDDQ